MPAAPPHFVRALRFRNYRLFFAGQSVSLIGSWITRLATSWLVWRLTHSPWYLGLVSFAELMPTLLLGPFAGVLVDRWNRHRTLVATQALSAVQSAALAWLAWSDHPTFAAIFALQLFQGVVNALDAPTRQAFLVEMVTDRADVPNAIALNSSLFNGSRLLGPAIGGTVVAAFGEGWCFAIDAVSYVAVLFALMAMDVVPRAAAAGGRDFRAEFREGARYVRRSPAVRTLLVLVGGISLLGMPYTVLMPDIATRALGGGAHTLGWLMTAGGAGALAGAGYLAVRRTAAAFGPLMTTTTMAFGAALIAFAWVATGLRSLPLALAVLPLTGFCLLVTTSAASTVMQAILPDALRGRVMAIYVSAFIGAAPLGSLMAGALAARAGTEATIVTCGLACVALGLWFQRQAHRLAVPVPAAGD